VGEPPTIERELAESKQKLQEAMERVPLKPILMGVVALLGAVIVGYMLFGPAEHLDRAGEKAGHALAENDVSYLKSIAVPGTADDIGRWFDLVYPRLVEARQRWHGGKDEVVESHVAQEDRAQHKGSVMISIHPALAGGLDVSLANPSSATAAADSPFDVDTDWTLSRWGHWQLDGRAALAKVQPTPSK
jgi:hypothetical protein